MTNTVFSKSFFPLLLCFLLLGMGCAFLHRGEERSLAVLQSAVRQRMLKFQSTELLTSAARERYNPRKAAEVFALRGGYQAQNWNVENDPALQVLENSITYALMALSVHPEKTAEKLTVAALDYGAALRLLKLTDKEGVFPAADVAAELSMMTGWSVDKVKTFSGVSLPEVKTELFSIYPEAERLLNEQGNAAAFQAAAELYQTPSESGIAKCERLRRAILNRYLLQTKSPGGKVPPELRIAFWRGRIFFSLLPPL